MLMFSTPPQKKISVCLSPLIIDLATGLCDTALMVNGFLGIPVNIGISEYRALTMVYDIQSYQISHYILYPKCCLFYQIDLFINEFMINGILGIPEYLALTIVYDVQSYQILHYILYPKFCLFYLIDLCICVY